MIVILLVVCFFLSFAASGHADGDSFVPRYAEPWPASVSALPTAPKPCLLAADCYAEPRNFIEAQWHEAPNGNLDEARHLHYGCAAPFHVRGVLRLDCRIQAFHMEGAIFDSVRKGMIRGHTQLPRLIPAPWKATKPGVFKITVTQHLQEFYVPIYFDTSQALYDGPALFESDVSFAVLHQDGIYRTHNVRLQFGVYLANGGGREIRSYGGGVAVEGWISTKKTDTSPYGYLRLAVPSARRFLSEAPSLIRVLAVGRPGHDTRLLATLNPDLHSHPPNYGLVMYPEWQPPMVVSTHQQAANVAFQEPWMAASDRLMFRWGDYTPDPESAVGGAGAVLLVIRLGKS